MKNRTEILIVLLIMAIFIALLYVALAWPGEKKIMRRHYDSQGNRTGFSVIENGRESRFDKDWNREGYSIHREGTGRTDHFDRDWNREGRSEDADSKTNKPFN